MFTLLKQRSTQIYYTLELRSNNLQVEQKIYLARQNMTKKDLVKNDQSSSGQKWPIIKWSKVTDRSMTANYVVSNPMVENGQKWQVSIWIVKKTSSRWGIQQEFGQLLL